MNSIKLLNIIEDLIDVKPLIKNYKKNEIIFYEGNNCEYISLIIKGIVTIEKQDIENNKIFSILHECDLFGNTLIHSSLKTYLGNVISLSSSEILQIPFRILLNLLNNCDFLLEYLKLLSDSRIEDKERITLLIEPNLEKRIISMLDIEDGKLYFKTIDSLAKYLACSREHLSRTLKKMKNDKLIFINKNLITNKKRL